MLRWAGALLLWSGCSLWGLQAAWELRRRTRLLEDLAGAMELLERELILHRTPLPELLIRLSEGTSPDCKQFFTACGRMTDKEKCFSDLWAEAAQQLPLSDSDRKLVLGLGQILGRYDARGQSEAVARVRLELEQRSIKAREEQKNLGRVYSMMGVTAGSVLALFLL